MLAGTVPRPAESWAERVPEMADPELRRYLTELAAAMDDRVRRIGEHAAQTRPQWAVQALGELPEDPAARADWEGRAARLGAYRELYGYDSPADAIGPEPGKTSPEARADWHAAFAALGRVEGIDLRGCTDDQLQAAARHVRAGNRLGAPYVGEELRLARLQARTAWENAIRAEHEARAAADPEHGRQPRAARRDVAGHAGQGRPRRRPAGSGPGDPAAMGALTEPTRRVAVAADLELRRRHPDMDLEPLKSAEPRRRHP